MGSDPVVVGAFDTAAEAEMARGRLAAAGIPSLLANAEAGTVLPVPGMEIRVEVLVDAEHAGRAAEILRETEPEEGEGRGEEDACVSCGALFPSYLDRCPACGLSYD